MKKKITGIQAHRREIFGKVCEFFDLKCRKLRYEMVEPIREKVNKLIFFGPTFNNIAPIWIIECFVDEKMCGIGSIRITIDDSDTNGLTTHKLFEIQSTQTVKDENSNNLWDVSEVKISNISQEEYFKIMRSF